MLTLLCPGIEALPGKRVVDLLHDRAGVGWISKSRLLASSSSPLGSAKDTPVRAPVLQNNEADLFADDQALSTAS
jgi:hypothetical protein